MRALPVAAFALALALAACAGRDKKEEEEQPAELQPVENTIEIREAWKAKLGEEAEMLRLGLAPVSDGTYIYAGARDGGVSAFDAQTGARRWRTERELPLAAGPGYGEQLLAIGSTDGTVTMLAAADGAVRWSKNLSAEVLARPVIGGGRVFVRTVDGHLRALDAASGNELWSLQREIPRLTLRGNSTPVIAGRTLIVSFDDGRVIAADRLSGDQVWEAVITPQHGRTEIERLADIDADLQLLGNELYVAGFQSRLAKLAADSGQEQWSFEVSSFEPPGVDWVHVYVTDAESEVLALDRATGAQLWRQKALRLRGLTGPTPQGTGVVVGDYEGYLHWLNGDDGSLVARVRADGGAIGHPPLVVGDMLYVQTDGGVLSAFVVSPPK
jgi:outer membrane protein assembly factor BamB